MSETTETPAAKAAETAPKPSSGDTGPAEQQDDGKQTNAEAAKLRRELRELRATAKEHKEMAERWKQYEDSQKSVEEKALKLEADLKAEREARQHDKVQAAVGIAATQAGLPAKLLPALMQDLGKVDLEEVQARVKEVLESEEWKPLPLRGTGGAPYDAERSHASSGQYAQAPRRTTILKAVESGTSEQNRGRSQAPRSCGGSTEKSIVKTMGQ